MKITPLPHDNVYIAVIGLLPDSSCSTCGVKTCYLSGITSDAAKKHPGNLQASKFWYKGVCYTITAWESPDSLETFIRNEYDEEQVTLQRNIQEIFKLRSSGTKVFATLSPPGNRQTHWRLLFEMSTMK